MTYLKKIIISIFIIELMNIFIGYCILGKDVFLPYTGFNEPPLYYDLDSLYGVTRLKNTKQVIHYSGAMIGTTLKTNTLGFRDEEFKKNGVLVLGNSFVEGYNLNAQERFSNILEDDLKIPFNNMGSAGLWTPIQSLILLKDVIKTKKMPCSKIIMVLTPGEICNLANRNPLNDSERNYPYRKKDSIVFYKSPNNNFNADLTLKDELKRIFKSTFISKIYTIFKYYGVSRTESKNRSFNHEQLNWFLNKIEKEHFEPTVEIIVVNNLMRQNIIGIQKYCSEINLKYVRVNVIEFPDNQELYFTSNGHLNKQGNKVLADLIKKTVFK